MGAAKVEGERSEKFFIELRSLMGVLAFRWLFGFGLVFWVVGLVVSLRRRLCCIPQGR